MNFIIYEDDVKYCSIYKNVVRKLLAYSNISYRIFEYHKWNEHIAHEINEIEGNKVYILDALVEGKNGIELARMIRNNGDWISPIIVITGYEKFKSVGYTSKILMLDFILKKENVFERLYDSLKIALNILGCKKSYPVIKNGEIYQIPYDDILYIEKKLNDNTSSIITKEEEYVVRKSIVNIEQELMDTNFCKTHRSCIVNINNVKRIDYENGIIFFENTETNLLSRSNRKIIKEKLHV